MTDCPPQIVHMTVAGGTVPIDDDGGIGPDFLPLLLPGVISNTLAHLKAMTTRPVAVALAGRDSPGDGHGAVYFWAAGSTTEADDIDTVAPDIDDPPGRWLAFSRIQLEIVTGNGAMVKVASYTAQPGDVILADTTAGSFTIKLPPMPYDRARVRIMAPNGSWTINPLRLDPNGLPFSGLTDGVSCDQPADLEALFYDGAWRLRQVAEVISP